MGTVLPGDLKDTEVNVNPKIMPRGNFTDPEYASVFYSSQTTPFYPQRGIAFSYIFVYSYSQEEI